MPTNKAIDTATRAAIKALANRRKEIEADFAKRLEQECREIDDALVMFSTGKIRIVKTRASSNDKPITNSRPLLDQIAALFNKGGPFNGQAATTRQVADVLGVDIRRISATFTSRRTKHHFRQVTKRNGKFPATYKMK